MKKKCIVREAVFAKVDQACYEWFMQQRSRSVPITGPILREKALQFYYKLYPNADDEKFKATTGWLTKFLSRHGIRSIYLQGESLSADASSVSEFSKDLLKYMEHEGYT